MIEVVDISGWSYENKEVSGSKEKRWYRHPHSNELVLFKLPISYTNENWTLLTEVSGETWAEKIASEIGEIIGITTQKVEIGSLALTDESTSYYGIEPRKIPSTKVIYGSLCYSFLEEGKESLIEGADMIMEIDETYDRKELKGQSKIYNYDLLERLFSEHNMLDDLFRMIVFDTLIGNTDRHQDNFGIIRNEITGVQRFSPLYDNSSSLGRELPTRNVELMLRDPQMFSSYLYGSRSSTLIRWETEWTRKRLNIFELFDKVFSFRSEVVEQLKLIKNLDDNILKRIMEQIPEEVMSPQHRRFVYQLIKSRRDYLEKRYLGGI
ncbi:HipA domain-containing protein [Paenibacillus koleovorans]|uniref:HipA domain-containing protein n=1 Tax=Paenibacillus koleovorans TaxID=121608 RepID=UPI000FDC61EF|nr:HipA domain-containing protein [Paenibacillus koleovorans]